MSNGGFVHFVRHGKPDIRRDVRLSRSEFREWWHRYDEVGLAPGETPPEDLLEIANECAVIISSTMPRACQTSELISNGREVIVSELFREAPLPPPLVIPGLRTTSLYWGILSRIVWWLGYSAGGESCRQAKVRARMAADFLLKHHEEKGDVMVCAHGWFNRMTAKELRRRGWTRKGYGGDRYWGVRSYLSPSA